MIRQAERAARTGQRVMVCMRQGNLVLEPFTGNIESVSLAGEYRGQQITHVDLDGEPQQ